MKGLLLDGLISVRGDTLLEGDFDTFDNTTGSINGRSTIEVEAVRRYPSDYRPWIKVGESCATPNLADDCTADRVEAGLDLSPPAAALCQTCSDATDSLGFGVLMSVGLRTSGNVLIALDDKGATGTFMLNVAASANGVLDLPGLNASQGRVGVNGALDATITQPSGSAPGSIRLKGDLTYSDSSGNSKDRAFDETFTY